VVVVVEDVTGGGTVVVCSVVVVFVTFSELPQAASKTLLERSAAAVKTFMHVSVVVMAWLRCHWFL
jgi:hypothetical protein